jgi:hypothetical protein
VPGWTVRRIWLLSVVLSAWVFFLGLLAASRVDLTGLLIVGPCCALLTGRWVRTAVSGALALSAGLALGAVATGAGHAGHAAFLAAVGSAALANTLAAAWLERHLGRQ